MAESIGYRSIVIASQSITWFVGQLLKLYFDVDVRRPPGLFERGSEQCLILASTHKSVLGPWLIMSALRFHQWRTLIAESLDLEAGASWLRERTLQLYERARRRGEEARECASDRVCRCGIMR
jgi:hypothetical protein